MKLIADSGSTKTSWVLTGDGKTEKIIVTAGINPAVQTDEAVQAVLGSLISALPVMPSEIYFYGAGCRGEAQQRMADALKMAFAGERLLHIKVESDLLGAARALFGDSEGIACILGTGSNSCLYNGTSVVENIPPLGYILGDEGSGAALGKMFLNSLFKGELPVELADEYLAETSQTYDDVIRRVYREQNANRYLASTSIFIAKHLDIKPLYDIVKYNIEQFFVKNVCRYSCSGMPVAAVGSIADAYREVYVKVANAHGFDVTKILKEPINDLVAYHSEHHCK
ncbi:MAG: ATPase [Prevotella sp.]|uniref:ATPase n=1 Tax=Prevotella sp. TaxID=59823 RepID=UPI002A288357|nr:ATPase [Prevotella sp.]MDD7318155.1 ATPase [Prevotellaceae bacterium]MDY4020956.1 ATPase [Prevotella sp.]